jgi:osmotically-inducible protein OsmY
MRPIVSSYRARRRAADRRPGPSALAAATAGGVAAGVLLEYFLDPAAGRRRRHQARDRAASRVRRGERRIAMRARRAESHAIGVGRRTLNTRRRRTEPLDDVTLTQKVQSELFRRAGIDKGHISVNAEDGVVFLRGTLEHTADIERLGEAARAIAGVREVENLLHVPGTPAPPSRSKLERQRSAS